MLFVVHALSILSQHVGCASTYTQPESMNGKKKSFATGGKFCYCYVAGVERHKKKQEDSMHIRFGLKICTDCREN